MRLSNNDTFSSLLNHSYYGITYDLPLYSVGTTVVQCQYSAIYGVLYNCTDAAIPTVARHCTDWRCPGWLADWRVVTLNLVSRQERLAWPGLAWQYNTDGGTVGYN